jgi:hypothetical protein
MTSNEAALFFVYAMVVIVAMSNAVNLTDGLDGLAMGPVLINAGTYMILAAQTAVIEKQVRLKQTSGTKIAQFDFAGFVAKPPTTFEDQDGVLTSKLDFTSKYNTTLANCFAASITNSVASLA